MSIRFDIEHWLQITDHWVTIIAGIFTVILTIIVIWLMWKTLKLTKKDEQKTIAINELQTQTNKLEQLYLHQIQPRFVTIPSSSGYVKIKNIAGDCYNLKILIIGETESKFFNPFEKWDKFYASQSQKSFHYHNHIYNYLFEFEDLLGNKMQQTLFASKGQFSNRESLA